MDWHQMFQHNAVELTTNDVTLRWLDSSLCIWIRIVEIEEHNWFTFRLVWKEFLNVKKIVQLFKSSPSFCRLLIAKLLIEWICIHNEWMLINAFRVQSKKKSNRYFNEKTEAFCNFYSMIQCNLSTPFSYFSFNRNRRDLLDKLVTDH